MTAARIPEDEARRLHSLRELRVLDTGAEPIFQDVVRSAAAVCNTPIALISLVDQDRQWFKANLGLEGTQQTSRDDAFCAHAILGDQLFTVADARLDDRFASNALVTGEPGIRFYAGAPVRLTDGSKVGTVCVIDRVPRTLGDTQKTALLGMADAVARLLEHKRDVLHGADNCADSGEVPVQLSAEPCFSGPLENQPDTELAALHQRLTLATQAGAIGTWEYHVGRDGLLWDAMMCALYGVRQSQAPVNGAQWLALIHPDDRGPARAMMSETLKVGKSFTADIRIIRPDGSLRHLRSAAQAATDDQGRTTRVVGVNWDVTQIREMAVEIERQHELMQVTLQSISDAVLTTDARGMVTWLNPAAERLTAWRSSAAKGVPLAEVFQLYDEDFFPIPLNPVSECKNKPELVSTTAPLVLVSRTGGQHGVEQSSAPILNAQGDLLGIVLVFRDVTEQRRLNGEMSHRATHDMVTGLINRSEFEHRLRKIIDSVQTDGGEHTVLYLDLDQFKLVNDACGHSVGDQLLIQVGRLLGESMRGKDTIARLGGDEFGVILEHCTTDQAKRVADQICERMSDFRFAHDDRRFRIGASIGMVPLDKRWTSAAAVMQAADSACYAAKDAGRNRVHVWFDTDQALRSRQGDMKWASRLEQALDEDRFILYGQKITALNTPSEGLYAEVLVRLRDVDGSIVPPGAFLPAAERFHLASRLDRWVLRKTIAMLRGCPDMALVETLSVNLSGQSIGDRTFHREANELLDEAGPEVCARICLEITETAAVTNIADASSFVQKVRERGVRVSLDDFGSGASSFGYLKKLKVDQIKIDGQFIKDLVDDALDDAAVRSFVEVARVVNAQTVAEFVDCPEVLARVREIGIHYAQGYLLHKPEALDGLLQALAQPATL